MREYNPMPNAPNIYSNNTPNSDFKCRMADEELKAFWPEWRVVRWLGGGSFGDVFQITRTNLGIRKDSALKVIQVMDVTEPTRPLEQGAGENKGQYYGQHSGRDGYDGTSIPESVYNEIRIMEILRGAPNIVEIEDFHYYRDTHDMNSPDGSGGLYGGNTARLYVRMELLTSFQELFSGRQGLPAAVQERVDKAMDNEQGDQYHRNSLNNKTDRNLRSFQNPELSKDQSNTDTLRFLPVSEICKIATDICTALDYCEKNRIIHRDIKPANMFVDRFGNYKIGDFGASRSVISLQTAHTMTGIGTISYMAPEIYNGRAYNHNVDIYALGLVLYQLLNRGRAPFIPDYPASFTTADVDTANYKRFHGQNIPKLVDVDSELDRIVRKACAYDAKDRYQTAADMKQDIEEYLRENLKQKNENGHGKYQTKSPQSGMEQAGRRLQDSRQKAGREPQGSKQKTLNQKQYPDNQVVEKKPLNPVRIALIAAAVCCVLIVFVITRHSDSSGDTSRESYRDTSRDVSTDTSIDSLRDTSEDSTSVNVAQTDASGSAGIRETEDNGDNTNDQEIIDIPDPVLKMSIQDTLGIGDREITRADALLLTSFEYQYNGEGNTIKDITGLSCFSNLTELTLYETQVTDISELSELTNLKELMIVYSYSVDKVFQARETNKSMDISALASLKNLNILILDTEQISDISALSGLTNLTELHLNYNQISDISALAGLTNLTKLYLISNKISDISPLAGLTNLTELMLDNNQLSDISSLAGLTNLTNLDLAFNQVSDISALSGLTNLKVLWLVGNPVLENNSREQIMEVLSELDDLETDF